MFKIKLLQHPNCSNKLHLNLEVPLDLQKNANKKMDVVDVTSGAKMCGVFLFSKACSLIYNNQQHS